MRISGTEPSSVILSQRGSCEVDVISKETQLLVFTIYLILFTWFYTEFSKKP